MDIKTIKDLDKLLKLCRKNGIETIKLGDIELTLNPNFLSYPRTEPKARITAPRVLAPGGITEEAQVQVDTEVLTQEELTDEQKLFWSVGGSPNETQ